MLHRQPQVQTQVADPRTAKFTNTILNRAVATSSASRRFQAAEDPDEFDQVSDARRRRGDSNFTGADQEIREFQNQLGSVTTQAAWIELERQLHEEGGNMTEAEKARSRVLGRKEGSGEGARPFFLEGDPEREEMQDYLRIVGAHDDDALDASIRLMHRTQRARRTKQREAEDAADASRNEERMRQVSDYTSENEHGTRIRSTLHDLINKAPLDADLSGSGPTKLPSKRKIDKDYPQKNQFLTLDEQMSGERAPGDRPRRAGQQKAMIGDEAFPGELPLHMGSAAEHARVQGLLQRRAQLKSLQGRMRDRLNAVPTDPSNPIHEGRRRVNDELARVEAELGKVKATAFIRRGDSVEARAPQHTERLARQTLASQINLVDPMNPGQQRMQATGQLTHTLKTKVTDEEMDDFVHHTVMSFHAPTAEMREESSRAAARLANQISQKVQTAHDKAAKQAQIRKLADKINPSGNPYSGVKAPGIGGQTLEDLQKKKQSMEGKIKVDGQIVDKPMGTSFRMRDTEYKDPRFEGLSVEDQYRAYNHDHPAPLVDWHRRRMLAKFNNTDFNEKKPEPFGAAKAQGRFMKAQAVARTTAFLQGTSVQGWDEKGKPVAFNSEQSRNVRVGLTPNEQYAYKVANPRRLSDQAMREAENIARLEGLPSSPFVDQELVAARSRYRDLTKPVTQVVPPTDTKTQFKVGKRNHYGQLLPGEEDQIKGPVTTVPWNTNTFEFDRGVRIPHGGAERPPVDDDPYTQIHEIRYVPTVGASGQSRVVNDPSGQKKVVPLVKTTDGRWVPTDRGTWNATDAENRSEDEIPRKIQYKYMDPSDLKLATSSERDTVRIKVPKIKDRQEQVLHLRFGDDDSRFNEVLGKTARIHARNQQLDVAKKVFDGQQVSQEELEKHGIQDESEAHTLAKAAIAAGFYAQRDRVAHGRVPDAANRMQSKMKQKYPKYGKFSDQHLGDTRFTVNEAFIQPSVTKVANFKFGLKHPFTSQSGQAIGIEYEGIRDRTRGISPQKLANRGQAKAQDEALRVFNTKTFVRDNEHRNDVVGKYVRWQKGALLRSPEFTQSFDDLDIESKVGKALTQAHEAINEGTYSYKDHQGKTQRVQVSDAHRRKAAQFVRKYNAAARNPLTGPMTDTQLPHPKFAGGVDAGKELVRNPGQLSRAFGHSEAGTAAKMLTHKNAMIGGAVVGTAIGAGYLYHRHQQSKLPEEERSSFYNKALPKPFTGPPIPKVRVTQKVRFGDSGLPKELGLSGKELPTGFSAGFERKTIKLRPVDRGYAKKAPIIGKVSVRGTKGGSALKGLTYYPDDPMKRSGFTRGTHDIKVLGKKVPGKFEIGDLKKVPVSTKNPNRMSRSDIEDLVWAHAGTDKEDEVRRFYAGGTGRVAKSVTDLFNDPDEQYRIAKRKAAASPEHKAFERQVVRDFSRVNNASR